MNFAASMFDSQIYRVQFPGLFGLHQMTEMPAKLGLHKSNVNPNRSTTINDGEKLLKLQMIVVFFYFKCSIYLCLIYMTCD